MDFSSPSAPEAILTAFLQGSPTELQEALTSRLQSEWNTPPVEELKSAADIHLAVER
jgi:hypothetical protein